MWNFCRFFYYYVWALFLYHITCCPFHIKDIFRIHTTISYLLIWKKRRKKKSQNDNNSQFTPTCFGCFFVVVVVTHSNMPFIKYSVQNIQEIQVFAWAQVKKKE